MRFSLIVLVLALLSPALAQDSYSEAAKQFDYDSRAPFDIKETSTDKRAGAIVHDITYASPKGGVVPAYLVVPEGKGKFAAIVWGHWMMPNSPTANRIEFLNEALAYASVGVVSLLIDAPMVRSGYKARSETADVTQQVVDLRRGLDLLLSRKDVDPKRIAFVGHSYDAQCGSILDAVDKRPAAFVFMGNPVSVREFVLRSETPRAVQFRKSMGADKINEYLTANRWIDPASYAGHLGPAPALFQYATHDEFIPVALARHYFARASGRKKLKFYDSTHALNSRARHDRYEFLRPQLALPALPPASLGAVPPIK